MNAASVDAFLKSKPFVPFKLSLQDGREFVVQHSELLVILADKRTGIHARRVANDFEFTWIELPLAATMQPVLNGKHKSRAKKK
jgi:hypothetical protein